MWNFILRVCLALFALAPHTADAQDAETMAAARVLAEKPQNPFFLWRAANLEKVRKEVKTKDIKVVGAKLGALWKALKPADKAKFEAESKSQSAKYAAYLATEAGKKASEKEKEARKAKQLKKAKRAVKAVPKNEKLKQPQSPFFLWLADNKKSLPKDVIAAAKKAGPMWKKLSEKEKKPYVDKAMKAKTDHEAYLKSAAGLKILEQYKAAVKPAQEKLMKIRRPPAKAKPKKKKAKKAKKVKKPKKAKATKPKKAKAKAKPKAKVKAKKAKSKKLTQISSFGIGIPIAILLGFLMISGLAMIYFKRGVSAMSTKPLLS